MLRENDDIYIKNQTNDDRTHRSETMTSTNQIFTAVEDVFSTLVTASSENDVLEDITNIEELQISSNLDQNVIEIVLILI